MADRLKLEEIDLDKYEFDTVMGIYSKHHGKWLTGWWQIDEDGRKDLCVRMVDKSGKSHCYIYVRVIGFVFIPRPEELKDIPYENLEIDHINGDSMDNSIDNLRWTDRKGNMNNPITKERISMRMKGKTFSEEHCKKIGDSLRGKPKSAEHIEKLKGRIVSDETRNKLSIRRSKRCFQINHDTGEIMDSFTSAKEASKKTGICYSSIKDACNGKRKTAGGCEWCYE